MKTCRKCKEQKDESDFYFDKKRNLLLTPCKTCRIEKMLEYREKHKEKLLEYSRSYFEKYKKEKPEKIKELSRNYYDKNIEKKKDDNKKYKLDHKQETNFRTKQRYAQRRSNGGGFTKNQWDELCKFYGDKCLSCKKTDIKLTIDHVVSVKNGGRSTIDNIQPLCQSCNSKKRVKTLDFRFDGGEYARLLLEK